MLALLHTQRRMASSSMTSIHVAYIVEPLISRGIFRIPMQLPSQMAAKMCTLKTTTLRPDQNAGSFVLRRERLLQAVCPVLC